MEQHMIGIPPTPPAVTVVRKVKSKGMHLEVTTELSSPFHINNNNKCTIIAVEHLPAAVFVDLHKARSRVRRMIDDVYVDAARDIDIELPQQLSSDAIVAVTAPLTLAPRTDDDDTVVHKEPSTRTSTAQLSVQMRYHPAKAGSDYVSVTINPPVAVVVGCDDGSGAVQYTPAHFKFSKEQVIEVVMPVGHIEDEMWVMVTTFGVTAITTLALAWAFIASPAEDC